jgi:diamine N-acetyltransferase
MENTELYLKVPSKDELEYRIKLISDPDTMSFNRGYGDGGTGVYHITQEQAENWYDGWIGVPGKFYAYIARLEDDAFIGEADIHFDAYVGIHMIGIIIEARHRGSGYAEEALRLLADYAFNEMKLDKIADKFPKDRATADRIFAKVGFIRQDNDLLVLTKSDFTAYMFSSVFYQPTDL